MPDPGGRSEIGPRAALPTGGARRGLSTFVGEVELSNESMTALVTGAGSGIGRASAVELAKLGARVALVGRDAEKLEGTRRLIGREDTLVEPCDVADRAGVDAMAGRVLAAFGAVDVLVCNAGINVPNRSLEKLA